MSPPRVQEHHEIAQQTQVENDLLQNIIGGLRAALAWQVRGGDFSRKLSTVRFIARSLQRHLDHLMALEEVNGYMDMVLETKPFLSKAIQTLKEGHEEFRSRTRQIVDRLEQVPATDPGPFAALCAELAELLDRLQKHSQKEVKLYQEAFQQEEGGEG